MPSVVMSRFFPLFLVALALVFSQVASGAPSCSYHSKDVDHCKAKCKSKLGWPGYSMGDDSWGSVVLPSSVDPGNRVASVCSGPKNAEAMTTPSGSTSTPSPGVPPPIVSPVSSSCRHHSSKTSSVPYPTPTGNNRGPLQETPSPSPSSTPTTTPEHHPPTSTPSSSSTSSSTPTSTPPSTNPGSSSTASPQDIAAYLKAHNSVRAQHGAADLVWADDLAIAAQKWADKCEFKHSGGALGPYGENLAAGTGDAYDIAAAVKSWTDESSEYDPKNPKFSHFTQVVWKATTRLGCAVKDCSGIFDPKFGIAHFHVCEYHVAGNVGGQFGENVQA